MELTPPDVLLLSPEWPERALLRAELIEAGYEVVAIEAWPMPGLYRRPGMEPRMAIVDLQGLPEPRTVLDELGYVMPPDRVLIVVALGTLTLDEVRQMGYQVCTASNEYPRYRRSDHGTASRQRGGFAGATS